MTERLAMLMMEACVWFVQGTGRRDREGEGGGMRAERGGRVCWLSD